MDNKPNSKMSPDELRVIVLINGSGTKYENKVRHNELKELTKAYITL